MDPIKPGTPVETYNGKMPDDPEQDVEQTPEPLIGKEADDDNA
jgi:hypothetical protein